MESVVGFLSSAFFVLDYCVSVTVFPFTSDASELQRWYLYNLNFLFEILVLFPSYAALHVDSTPACQ